LFVYGYLHSSSRISRGEEEEEEEETAANYLQEEIELKRHKETIPKITIY
jgi:hypothetical protein